MYKITIVKLSTVLTNKFHFKIKSLIEGTIFQGYLYVFKKKKIPFNCVVLELNEEELVLSMELKSTAFEVPHTNLDLF